MKGGNQGGGLLSGCEPSGFVDAEVEGEMEVGPDGGSAADVVIPGSVMLGGLKRD